jgi:predicted dehydrogenase
MAKLRIALIGAGNRARSGWLPVIAAMKEDFVFVAVCDAVAEKAEAAAASVGAAPYTDIDALCEREKPNMAACVVSYDCNHVAATKVARHGVHVVMETPIAITMPCADLLLRTCSEGKAKLEVGENYYRYPNERIKRALLLAGAFGRVFYAHNGYRGHGYHGVGLLRSYAGFDNPALRVIGMTREFTAQPHTYRGQHADREAWNGGLAEFQDGAVGVFSHTGWHYGSPIRPRTYPSFYAERGSVVGDEITLLNEDGETARTVMVTRHTHSVDGVEVLDKLVAETQPAGGSSPEVVWENPVRRYPLPDGHIAVASELLSLAEAIRNNTEPEYGGLNGRWDREIDLAMTESDRQGHLPVTLPLPAVTQTEEEIHRRFEERHGFHPLEF